MFRYVLVLGWLSALTPFAIDMYLPGLPAIMRDLGTGEGAAQMSLMSFFVGLTVGQLFFGPLSDRFGRKPILYLGLGLFGAASVACGLAGHIESLIVARLVQGFGGAAETVVGFAIVRDLYTGVRAARLLSLTILILGLSPIVAPLVGSFVIELGSWHAIFFVIAATAVTGLALVRFALPETRPPALRRASRLGATFGLYGRLLLDARFLTAVMVCGLAQAGLFAYLAGSSFAFISVYGLSPRLYSIVFAVNAVGLILGAQVTPNLIARLGAVRLIRAAAAAYAATALLLTGLVLAGMAPLAVFWGLLFVCQTCLAFILSPSNMLALEPHGAVAGTASALMTALQFACGTVASAAVSLAADGTVRPMVLVIAACAAASFVLAKAGPVAARRS